MQETAEDVEEAEKPAKKRLNFRFSFRKKSKIPEEGSEPEPESKVEDEKETPPAPYPRQEWKLKNFFKSNKSKENEEDKEIDNKGPNFIYNVASALIFRFEFRSLKSIITSGI